jgi:pimeloyl-ACP methyl ester carboxylesterase
MARPVPISGPPVVMVHGWGGSFDRTWAATGVSLIVEEEGRPVVPVDLLGHGSAPKPHDVAAYADLTDRVLAVLPTGDAPVDAVGFSMGAFTLLQILARHPNRFGKVVLSGIGNGVFTGGSGFGEQVAAAVEAEVAGSTGAGLVDGSVRAMVGHAMAPGNDPLALAAAMRRPMPADPVTADRLSSVTTEVLVIIGENDFAAPADQLAAAFPRGELKVLKRVDHFATPEDFGFIDAVVRFLTK